MLPYLGGRWGSQQPDPSPCPQKRHGDRDDTWGVPWVASLTTPMDRSQAKIAIGRPHHTGKPVGFGSKRSRYLSWPHLVNVLAVQNGFCRVIPALPPLSQSCM